MEERNKMTHKKRARESPIKIPGGFSPEAIAEITKQAKDSARETAKEASREAASTRIKYIEDIVSEVQKNIESARKLFENKTGADMMLAQILFQRACNQLNSIAAFKTEAATMEEIAKLFSGSPLKIIAIDLATKAKARYKKIGDLKGVARMRGLLKENQRKLKEYARIKEKEQEKEKNIQDEVKRFEKELREKIKQGNEVKEK